MGGFMENCWLYSLNSDGTNLELLAANEGRDENWFTYCTDGGLYIEINSAVYSYHTGENGEEKLLSYSDIGLKGGKLCELDDGRFIFTGNSSNDTANAIQSRASIYVAEQCG